MIMLQTFYQTILPHSPVLRYYLFRIKVSSRFPITSEENILFIEMIELYSIQIRIKTI